MTASADNVEYLPVWKANATAEERLLELAMMARKHPERFAKFVLVYQEATADDATVTRYAGINTTTTELLGLLRQAEHEVFQATRR